MLANKKYIANIPPVNTLSFYLYSKHFSLRLLLKVLHMVQQTLWQLLFYEFVCKFCQEIQKNVLFNTSLISFIKVSAVTCLTALVS